MFNGVIRECVEEHDDWHLVDTGGVFDSLAVKRNGYEDPEQALVSYYTDRGRPDHPLLDLKPVPSTLKLETTGRGTRTGGGLTSLDFVHPSTIGYAIVAEAFLAAMQQAGVSGADPRQLDWAWITAQDSVLQAPPQVWDDVLEAARRHSTLWDLIFRAMT